MIGTSQRGLPQSMSIILLSLLVIAIVLVVAGMLTGFAGLLHQTPLIAVRGSVFTTPSGVTSLVLIHSGGTTVGLNPASTGSSPPPVRFTITAGTGVTAPVALSETSLNRSWSPGTSIYFYQDGKGFWVTDSIPARLSRTATLGPITDMPHDTVTIRIIDVKTNVTVANVVFVPGTGH
ncbi:MAG TPA: hypothetical protein VMT44_00075 [Methanoregula sp.]|nr:hypothetical protein [Methanoregula sp.]